MATSRQFSLNSLALLFTGSAITIGLIRAIVLDPFPGCDGKILAAVVGLWCGVFYGSFLAMPRRCALFGVTAGMAYALFAP